MLRVSVNLKQGVYIISEDDGQKTITVPINGKYDKNTIKGVREEIQRNNRHIIARKKLESIDVGVYQAIKQFDSQYGTNHAYGYANAIGKEILDAYYDATAKGFEEKMAGIRAAELEKAGVNVEYNISLLGGLGKMKLGERVRAIRTALSQRKNGINVQFSDNSKQPLLQAPITMEPEIIQDDIPEMPDEATLGKMRKEAEQDNQVKETPKIPEQPKVAQTQELSNVGDMTREHLNINPSGQVSETQINRETIEALSNPNQTSVDQMLQNLRREEEENPKLDPSPAATELQAALAGRRVSSPSREEGQSQATKKKISRSKAIQASKQAQREAGKLKNRYKGMQQAKAERKARATDPEQIRLAAERRAAKEEQKRIAEEQRKAAEAEQRRADAERKREEQEQKRQEVENNKPKNRILAFIGRGPKREEGSFKARFTRKVKNKSDSIRNKKFIPKVTEKQKKIGKAVTVVTLTAALALATGIGTYRLLNSHTADVESPANTPTAVENVNPGHNVDKDGIEFVLGKHDADTKTPTAQAPSQDDVEQSAPIQEIVEKETLATSGDKIQEQERPETTVTPESQTQEQAKPATSVQEQESQGGTQEKDSKKEYLSSIKVGATLNIESGRYFETPEGQGRYGHFESFTNGVKRIQFIDVITDEGYVVIKDDSVNLWELKQQYPNAKFSYHIVYENEDGTTMPLGWLTSESQELDQQHVKTDIDDMDM